MEDKRERIAFLWNRIHDNTISALEFSEFLDLMLELEGAEKRADFISDPIHQQKIDAISARQQDIAAHKAYDETLQQFKQNKGRGFKIIIPCFVALFLTGIIIFLCHKPRQHPAHYSKPYDTFNSFADGSKIVLKGGSTLTHDYQNKREIGLTGTAFFNIAADPSKPFIIKSSGDIQTKVLGTTFNLSTREPGFLYVLNIDTGEVKVSCSKTADILASEGEQIKITDTYQVIKGKLDATQKLWLSKDVSFNNQSIESISKTLQTRYDVNVIFQDAIIPHKQITVIFKGSETIKEVASTISQLAHCDYFLSENNLLFRK